MANMPMLRRLFVLAFWAALVFAFVMASLPKPPPVPGDPGDKVQHIIAFVTLTLLARFAYPRANPIALLLAFAGFGAAIEFVQMIPALGRDAALDDWGADVAASAITLLILEPLRRLFARRSRSAPQHVIDEPA